MTATPWNNEPTSRPAYGTVAAAEQAIKDAGYVRNNLRSMWTNPAGRTAEVMRDDTKEKDKFFVQWG